MRGDALAVGKGAAAASASSRQLVVDLGATLRAGVAGGVDLSAERPAYYGPGGAAPSPDGGGGTVEQVFNMQAKGFAFADDAGEAAFARMLGGWLGGGPDVRAATDVFFATPPACSEGFRDRLVSLCMETLGVQGCFALPSSVCNLYSVGLTSGISVDCSARCTAVSYVSQGISRDRYSEVGRIGGNALTDMLQGQLPEEALLCGSEWRSAQWYGAFREAERLREVYGHAGRQGCGRGMMRGVGGGVVAAEDDVEESVGALPDGTPLAVRRSVLGAAGLLVDPTVQGSIPAMLRSMGNSFNIDQHSGAAAHVNIPVEDDPSVLLTNSFVVTGGVSLTREFCARLSGALLDCFPSHPIQTPIVHEDAGERRHAAWLGGSVAAFHMPSDLFISKLEYDEVGADIVREKCPI